MDRLIHFVVEPPNCRWNGAIHQAEEHSCQPLTVKLCTCHTIGAHLVDPPFIPSSGYLVLPLCRQYFDPQMGLGHVGLQQQPLVVLGWPVPMVIRELTPSKFCLRGLSAVGLRWLHPRNHHRWCGSLHGPSTLVSFINGCHWTRPKVADLTLALHNWPEYLSWLHPRNHHRRCGSGLLRGPNVWAP